MSLNPSITYHSRAPALGCKLLNSETWTVKTRFRNSENYKFVLDEELNFLIQATASISLTSRDILFTTMALDFW
jgi:hypothetical protein